MCMRVEFHLEVVLVLELFLGVEVIQRAEELVEPEGARAILNRFREIDLGGGFSGVPVGVDPIEAEVPLADAGRPVSAGAQQGCDRRAPVLDQVGGVPPDHPLFEGGAPRIATGEDAVP